MVSIAVDRAASRSGDLSVDSVDTDVGQSAAVQVKLMPVGCELPRATVRTEIVPAHLPYDLFSYIADGAFQWERIAKKGAFDNVSLEPLITITVAHPPLPCHWRRTRVYSLHGGDPTDRTMLWVKMPTTEGGPIPEEGSAYLGSAGKTDRIRNTQTRFVPGDLLQLEWTVEFGGKAYRDPVHGVWFHSPAFFGGKILEKMGVGEETQFVVDALGHQITCTPTDFADYQVGDWVYLLKDDQSAKQCSRKRSYGGGTLPSFGTSADEKESRISAGEILRIVNQVRQEHGLSPLSVAPELTRAAARHSDDMAQNDFASHTGSDGTSPRERITGTGYGGDGEFGTGENVAFGQKTAEAVMTAWMNSPGHRANILDGQFTEIGIAVAYNTDGHAYFTQKFGYREEVSEEDHDYFDPADPPPATAIRVTPMTVNSVGGSGGYETLDYSMMSMPAFREFFEISRHVGVVTSVNIYSLSVDIDISEDEESGINGSFQNVPVFYHCPDSEDTNEGIQAFEVDDTVIVLNEGGRCNPHSNDLVVVGFEEELKPCARNLVVVFRLGYSSPFKFKFIEIDEDGNIEEFPLLDPDTDDVLQQPVELSYGALGTVAQYNRLHQTSLVHKSIWPPDNSYWTETDSGSETDHYVSIENSPWYTDTEMCIWSYNDLPKLAYHSVQWDSYSGGRERHRWTNRKLSFLNAINQGNITLDTLDHRHWWYSGIYYGATAAFKMNGFGSSGCDWPNAYDLKPANAPILRTHHQVGIEGHWVRACGIRDEYSKPEYVALPAEDKPVGICGVTVMWETDEETDESGEWPDDITRKYYFNIYTFDGASHPGHTLYHPHDSDPPDIRYHANFSSGMLQDRSVIREEVAAFADESGYRHYECNVYFQGGRPEIGEGEEAFYHHDITAYNKIISTAQVMGWFNVSSYGLFLTQRDSGYDWCPLRTHTVYHT